MTLKELKCIAHGFGFTLVEARKDEPRPDLWALVPAKAGGIRHDYPYPGVGYYGPQARLAPSLTLEQVEWILGQGSPWHCVAACHALINGLRPPEPGEILEEYKILASRELEQWLCEAGMPDGPVIRCIDPVAETEKHRKKRHGTA